MIRPVDQAAPARAAEPSRRQGELRTAAQAFEAVFLRQMIGSMRQARLADDPFGSQAAEQFRDMSDARLADEMSRQGSFGIAQMLLAQFEQRVAPAEPARPERSVDQ